MNAAQVGHLLGSHYADEQLRRRGVAAIADPTLHSHGREAWAVAGRVVDEGPQDVVVFMAAFVAAFRGVAHGLHARSPR